MSFVILVCAVALLVSPYFTIARTFARMRATLSPRTPNSFDRIPECGLLSKDTVTNAAAKNTI